jgi:UDP-glucose 4-epimerase
VALIVSYTDDQLFGRKEQLMILITGGLGFIGTATVQALLEMGEECVLIQRRAAEVPEGRFSQPVTAVQGDVKDIAALRAIGREHEITGIVHLAGSMPWPADPELSPAEDARRALGGLFNLVEVAEEWGVKRVCLASTIGVYAGLQNTGALTEDLPITTTAPHLIPTFKKVSELLSGHLSTTTRVQLINLRISGTWGPLGHLPDPFFPASQLVLAAARGTAPDLSGVAGYKNLQDGLDLLYVKDTGRAIALLQLAETLNHHTYNVASGRFTDNAEILTAIRATVPEFSCQLPEGSSGPARWLDIGRLTADTGFTPEWDTKRAAADYIDWLRAGNAV